MTDNKQTREERGSVKTVLFVEQYPNGEIRAYPYNAAQFEEIVLSADEIERRLGGNPEFWRKWNTGDWKENPSVLFVLAEPVENPYVLASKHEGHEHPPIACSIIPDEGATFPRPEFPLDVIEPGKNTPVSREERGTVKTIVFVEQYPNGEIRTYPYNAAQFQEIVISADEIERRLGDNPDFWRKWNTGDWKENFSLLFVMPERTERPYVGESKHEGHQHRPVACSVIPDEDITFPKPS